MAWQTLSVYCAFPAFLESHHHHEAASHPIISKVMFFYLWLPRHKHFDPWDVLYLWSLLKSWNAASSY